MEGLSTGLREMACCLNWRLALAASARELCHSSAALVAGVSKEDLWFRVLAQHNPSERSAIKTSQQRQVAVV